MKLKIRIFLLIAAGLSVIFLVVGAVQAKYQEKRLTNELRIKAGSVAEITGISAGILINENTGNKLKELTAGFENNKRSQGCIIYDASGLVAASSRSFEGIGNSDSGLAKTVITSGVPEYFQVYNGGLMVLKYIAPVKNRTNSTGAVEVIYDMSYIKSGIYKSWVRLGIIALCFIFFISIIAFDFVEKTFFLPEKKLNEMIRKLRNRGAENKYGILKDFENLMKDFEDTSFIKAFIDERTQLKNYRFYKDVITPVLESDNDICLAVIDIDDFKKINTAFGHDAGDRVIKTVSSIISRFADDACRYGGEEFVFLFKNDVISFQGPCEKIRRAVENEAATAAGIATPVTISIGAAACKEAELIYKGEKERVVFRIADQRLLRAKQSGKNMVIFRD